MRDFYNRLQTLQDIQSLIDHAIRESETPDYKSATEPFKSKDVSKDVSAMANSAGGVLIYGVTTDKSDKSKPVAIEGLLINHYETFDQIVNSTIQRPILGIERKIISAGSKHVLAVYVPQSAYSPHYSTANERYYHRSGTESRPMAHDLIELHFGRRLGPILAVEIKSLNRITEFTGDPPTSNDVALRVSVTNHGQRIGRYVEVVLTFPAKTDVPRLTTTSGSWWNLDRLYQGSQTSPSREARRQ